jgi:hypothetical protein
VCAYLNYDLAWAQHACTIIPRNYITKYCPCTIQSRQSWQSPQGKENASQGRETYLYSKIISIHRFTISFVNPVLSLPHSQQTFSTSCFSASATIQYGRVGVAVVGVGKTCVVYILSVLLHMLDTGVPWVPNHLQTRHVPAQ